VVVVEEVQPAHVRAATPKTHTWGRETEWSLRLALCAKHGGHDSHPTSGYCSMVLPVDVSWYVVGRVAGLRLGVRELLLLTRVVGEVDAREFEQRAPSDLDVEVVLAAEEGGDARADVHQRALGPDGQARRHGQQKRRDLTEHGLHTPSPEGPLRRQTHFGRGVEAFWTPLRLISRKSYIVFRVSWLRYCGCARYLHRGISICYRSNRGPS
jgi:hypothetical protein